MNNIIIESLEYNGENYFYKNDKFKKGVNIILGENQHGKTTFSYLIMYVLGFKVEAFTTMSEKAIDEVCNDKNNYVNMNVCIKNKKYMFKRKIRENVISVIVEKDVTIYPIDRRNSLFDKDNKTFSDWLLETLEVDLIKVENIFSSEHYLNFDDLFRYNYYDQETPKSQMISDFGTGSNVLRKTSQIKKFIFETLLSCSNHEYYANQKRMKENESEIREKKSEVAFKQKVFDEISNSMKLNLSGYSGNEIIEEIKKLQEKKEELLNSPIELNNKKDYLDTLKINLDKKQVLIQGYKEKDREISLELGNAKRLHNMERKEIKTLETLATLPAIYEAIENTCPICGKSVNHEKSKCVCGNACDVNSFHFIYSKADYTDILKSKVSVNKTTSSVIESLKSELDYIRNKIIAYEQQIEQITFEIKQITSELVRVDIEQTILSINKQISVLNDIQMRTTILEKEMMLIDSSKSEIKKLEKNLELIRQRLKKLEIEKYETLQEHIDKFQDFLNKYFKEYYTSLNQEYNCEMILNKDYMPVSGIHNPHSRVTEIKIFFYLTLLKYSIVNSNISYPKLLIIDTIKDHGIDNKRVEKILENIFEFDELDCQIIMTCGYEEFQAFGDKYNDLIIERIDDSKLLNKK